MLTNYRCIRILVSADRYLDADTARDRRRGDQWEKGLTRDVIQQIIKRIIEASGGIGGNKIADETNAYRVPCLRAIAARALSVIE